MSEEDKMTRDEILNMPAGRVLDALVAEKVMDWHWYKFLDPKLVDEAKGAWLDKDNRVMHNEWLPSTDIADAWQVVEKMQSFELEMDYQESWHAYVNFPGEEWYSSIGDTAPLTICRAALLAVMDAE